jgi:hypothetical protein
MVLLKLDRWHRLGLLSIANIRVVISFEFLSWPDGIAAYP